MCASEIQEVSSPLDIHIHRLQRTLPVRRRGRDARTVDHVVDFLGLVHLQWRGDIMSHQVKPRLPFQMTDAFRRAGCEIVGTDQMAWPAEQALIGVRHGVENVAR